MGKFELLGWILTIVAVAPLLISGILDVCKASIVVKNTEFVGYPLDLMVPFGLSKLLISILTLFPMTSFFGSILATGWMGGAIAAHVRIRDKFYIQAAIPILIWLGFGLRHLPQMEGLIGIRLLQ